MKIFIGSDHRGFILKSKLIEFLKKKGYRVEDAGTFSRKSCDYPLIAYEVARKVKKNKQGRGILVCMTGIGNSIVANKVPGIRASLCYNIKAARLSRQHNDSNLLVLGKAFVNASQAKKMLNVWLTTPFSGGRHKRRVNQISKIEKNIRGK